jgi:hypothetical protein
LATPLAGTGMPIFSIASLNNWRSSALAMASGLRPDHFDTILGEDAAFV